MVRLAGIDRSLEYRCAENRFSSDVFLLCRLMCLQFKRDLASGCSVLTLNRGVEDRGPRLPVGRARLMDARVGLGKHAFGCL